MRRNISMSGEKGPSDTSKTINIEEKPMLLWIVNTLQLLENSYLPSGNIRKDKD